MGGTTLTIHAGDEQLQRAAHRLRAALERLETSELMHAVGGEVLATTWSVSGKALARRATGGP